MFCYNKKFITKIRNYLNEDYSDANFTTKIKDFLISYQYKFGIEKVVPIGKTKHPYYILNIKLIFKSIEEVNEQFRLYPYRTTTVGSRGLRRRYFNDIIRNTIQREVKNMFGEELITKVSFKNEKIFDLIKK